MLKDVLVKFMIAETKLNDFCLEQKFRMESFNIAFRLDRHRYGGGLLLYIRNNTNAVLFKSYAFIEYIEAFFIEQLLKSCKWLRCCSYHPDRINAGYSPR